MYEKRAKHFHLHPKKNACCLTIPAEQVIQFVKKSVGAFFHRDAHFFYSLLTLSQFLSFKICHKTFANFIKFFDRRIERLLNCEKVGYKKTKWKRMNETPLRQDKVLASLEDHGLWVQVATWRSFFSFEIRSTSFLDWMKLADLLILGLENCERTGRAKSWLAALSLSLEDWDDDREPKNTWVKNRGGCFLIRNSINRLLKRNGKAAIARPTFPQFKENLRKFRGPTFLVYCARVNSR